MGQQQLLLLVLGILIVGIAVVVGISAFGANAQKMRYDRQLKAVSEIASHVNVWNNTSPMLGGNLGLDQDLSFERLGLPHVASDETIRFREGVGCLRVFSVLGEYDAVRIYDLEACPGSRGALSDDDLTFVVRIYPDHWRYYNTRDGLGTWERVDW